MKIKDMNWDSKGTKAWRFYCPGCNSHHAAIEGRWTFNGNYEYPTFTPSLLIKSGHYSSGDSENCWCTYHIQNPEKAYFECSICHLFITDGKIQYLNDCTHKFAGQTIELSNID